MWVMWNMWRRVICIVNIYSLFYYNYSYDTWNMEHVEKGNTRPSPQIEQADQKILKKI